MTWDFRAGTATREDGLRVNACLRQSTRPDPHLSPESLAQGMEEVAWEITFPDHRRVEIPWKESLATPNDVTAHCDTRWPSPL